MKFNLQKNEGDFYMARQNYVSLLGVVQKEKKPTIVTDADGNFKVGIAFLRVVRGPRQVGDGRLHVKYDSPVIWTQDPVFIEQMNTWEVGDAIIVKGTVATKNIMKTSSCQNEECRAKNRFPGTLVYVNPIHFLKVANIPDEKDVGEFLEKNGEISNQVQVLGTLVRDPKKISPKAGLVVTQYQIAMNRKYRIKTDDPDVKTDYPWVKSYGENAISDRQRLHVGSEIYVDGCLQARNVQRHAVCATCGQPYDWRDNVLEIVPFATEYLSDYYTDEEVADNERKRIEQAEKDIFGRVSGMEVPDDEITKEDLDAGIDTEN